MKRIFLAFALLICSLAAEAHQFGRMIVFGDSLSDGGTYSAFFGPMGGGKFTVNPGTNWIDRLSQKLELPISLNRMEGFGMNPVTLGGLNYAQGGARVKLNPGIGTMTADGKPAYSARPIAEQVKLYTDVHQRFESSDLVIVEAGANDIFFQATRVLTGKAGLADALKEMDQATSDLAVIVKAIKENGSPNIVVTTVSDMTATPRITALGPQAMKVFGALLQKFNQDILRKIKGLSDADVHGLKIRIARLDQVDKSINRHPKSYGLTNLKDQACKKELLSRFGNSAIMCQTAFLVSPEALETYKFSDDLHPTPKVYAIFADYLVELVASERISP